MAAQVVASRVVLGSTEFISSHIVFLRSVLQLLVIANAVNSSLILVTLMMVMHSSETSVLTRATRPIILVDGILHIYT
jgi:hypothetical protein